jgi:hypothetical protein
MTDRSQRVIAALEVEAAMTEAPTNRLSNVAPNLADPGRRVCSLVARMVFNDRHRLIRTDTRATHHGQES